jgi:hypothetical protein
MPKGDALVWVEASTPVGKAISLVRNADYAVIHSGDDLFAFRPYELKAVDDKTLSLFEALDLEPWKKTCQVTIGASKPALLLDPKAPSTMRFVIVGADGKPVRVVEAGSAQSQLGGLPHESTSIVRYPSIDATGTRQPGATFLLRIDLALEKDATTSGDPLTFGDLPENWKEFPVSIVVSSPHLELALTSGTVLVRRDAASVPCVIPATVKPGGEQRVDVTVVFSREDRWCGTAQRSFTDADAKTTGTLAFVAEATAPDLTVHIHRDTQTPTKLYWLLCPAAAHRAYVTENVGAEATLPDEPSAFVQALFKTAGTSPRGGHVAVMQGIGEVLWNLVPASVRTNYWKLRDALGAEFSIQFLTDEPWIPWELMRPVREGAAGAQLLAETHPVARGLLAYPDRLRPKLPATGERLTIAPDYSHRQPPLPALAQAVAESSSLKDRFHATAVEPCTAKMLLDILQDQRGTPIQLIHFAGHGAFNAQALFSTIAFEDADVRVAQIRRQEVVLGAKYKTFIILNACEVGATGDVLGAVGGWAEAFAYRDFSGFLAPLWAVFDGHAKIAMEAFLDAVLDKKQPVGRALRDVRRENGAQSATFLSYVYYGDVNARFG